MPGCPTLTPQGRSCCPTHTRQLDRERGTRQERGYDRTFDRLRADWQKRIDGGEAVYCWRCDARIIGRPFHLGHDDHDRTTIRGPECVSSNLSAAGRASHGLPREPPIPPGGTTGADPEANRRGERRLPHVPLNLNREHEED